MINKQRGATTNGESEQKSLKERNVAIEKTEWQEPFVDHHAVIKNGANTFQHFATFLGHKVESIQ